MMFKYLLFTGLSFFVFFVNLQAQESWSLERCVIYANENNLGIKQAATAVDQARLTQKQARLSRYPTANLSSNAGWQFGRTIDPTTNAFRNQTISYNSFSFNTGAPLYSGGRINKSIKQADLDLKAARSDVEDSKRNIALTVARGYLQILFSQEQLLNAQKRLELTQGQLTQTDRLIQAGSLPENDRLDILAQIARDEQTVIVQQNALDIAYLELKQLLELDPDYDMVIEMPEVNVPDPESLDTYSLTDVYNLALNNQPAIEAGALRVESAKVGVDVAKADLLPSVSVFGSLSSNYSSIKEDFTNPNLENTELVLLPPEDVVVGGIPTTLEQYTIQGLSFPKTPYFSQLDENFGQSIGFSLSVPIFNGNRARTSLERARLNVISTELNNKQIHQQLKSDIQRTIADARAAGKQYEAAKKTVEALKTAFENTEKRYALGAVNTFDLTTARNNLDQAGVDLIVARYDYVFKLKIIDFYLGKDLKI